MGAVRSQHSFRRKTAMSNLLVEFYGEHRGKPFFEGLISFMTSGNIVALELLAAGAIQLVRS
jgi:nucleoside-diphosphate kinase